jgi:hypothetical protein
MTPAESLDAFAQFAQKRGVSPSSSNASQGVAAMLQFFEDVRPDRTVIRGADWLLFQWGCYDWGQGEHFEIDVTRQFVERVKVEGEDEEVISQLSLRYSYSVSEQTKAFGKGNRWCRSKSEIPSFRDFIDKTAPFNLLKDSSPLRVHVHWGRV